MVISSWMEHVEDMLASVDPDDIPDPSDPGLHSDHYVGVVPPDLRKLHYVWVAHYTKLDTAADEVNAASGEDRDQKLRDYQWLQARTALLKELFWVSLRYAFPELCLHQAVGIRAGWRIVWFDPNELFLTMFVTMDGAREEEDAVPHRLH